jgi:hypothetical protein
MPNEIERPFLGILGWEDTRNANLYGSLATPGTFPFPFIYRHVKGACYESIIANPSQQVLDNFKAASKTMEQEGAGAITTSCGFNSIFQRELADAVSVPVFTSALIQIPWMHHMLNSKYSIGIITANSSHLTTNHLLRAGIPESIRVYVAGIEQTPAYEHICNLSPSDHFDKAQFRRDIVNLAKDLIDRHPDIGSVVLEMTILHIFSEEIRKAIHRPVFDIVQLAKFVFDSVN